MLLPPVRRRQRFEIGIGVAFTIGAVAGGVTTGTLLFLGHALLMAAPVLVVTVPLVLMAGIVALVNLVTGNCLLWQTQRQIAADVVTGRTSRGAFLFAYQLGTGLVTFLPSCAPHVLALLLLAPATPLAAIAIAAVTFGLGRSAGFVIRATTHDRDGFEQRFQVFVAIVQRYAPAVLVLSVILIFWN